MNSTKKATPAPSTNKAQAVLWQQVINNSGHFFDLDTMRFFNSRIVWNSLTGISADELGFITSEKWLDDARRYSVKLWTLANGVDDLSDFQQFATLEEARHYLSNAGFATRLAELRGDEEECTEQAPETINFYSAPITGQSVAECTECTYRTTYWECACELQHNCDDHQKEGN